MQTWFHKKGCAITKHMETICELNDTLGLVTICCDDITLCNGQG